MVPDFYIWPIIPCTVFSSPQVLHGEYSLAERSVCQLLVRLPPGPVHPHVQVCAGMHVHCAFNYNLGHII